MSLLLALLFCMVTIAVVIETFIKFELLDDSIEDDY